MRYGCLTLGILLGLYGGNALGQEISDSEESTEIADNTGDDSLDESSDEDIQLDEVWDAEPPDGASDYEEIYQMRTLERTVLGEQEMAESSDPDGILPPENPMGLAHDAAMNILVDKDWQAPDRHGLQRRGSALMEASLAQVQSWISEPGAVLEQPFGQDYTSQPAVQEVIAIFSSPGAKTMKSWLKRLGRYRDVLEKALREEGVPTDLIYLAMIESGYKNKVRSPAGAVGMWQFMAATAVDMGLKIDSWVDERQDPIKAAHAAAQYLKKQYDRFHSWPLAMAAYNGGAGTVNVAIDRFNTNDYFKLVKYGAMYEETRRYVPRILAAATLGKNPARFGFDGLVPEDPFVFDEVEVPPETRLAVLSEAAGCDTDTLKDLNPELLKEMTPPGRNYVLRIPQGRHRKFVENFDKAEKKYANSKDVLTLRFGETLETLGADIEVAPRVLRYLNHLGTRDAAPYGMEIIVPNGSRRKEHKPEELPVALVSPEKFNFPGKNRVFYETQSGDSLNVIADAFGVKSNQIALWNELDPWAKLRSGMKLQIFVAADGPNPDQVRFLRESEVQIIERGSAAHQELIEARKRAGKAAAKGSTGTQSTSGRYIIHTVAKGDTLSKIAKKYGVTVKSILELNKIKETTPIHKGQQLKVKHK